MNLIHFFSQDRVYNLKVCFATKIIICQLLVGGGGKMGREEETSGTFHLGVNYLSRSHPPLACSAPVNMDLYARV